MAKKKKALVTTKEYERIRRQISRMEKRGYMFSDDFKEKITRWKDKKVGSALKRMTTKKLYENAEFVDVETGEIVSGARGRAIERQRAAEKAKETRERKKRELEEQQETPYEWQPEEPEQEEQPEEPPYEWLPDEGPPEEPDEELPDESDIILEVIRELIERLTTPPNEQGYTKRGKKAWRPGDVKQAEQDAKSSLLRALYDAIERDGKRETAARLKNQADDISEAITIMEYTRYRAQIAACYNALYTMISGGSSPGVNRDLAAESEAYEDWEI